MCLHIESNTYFWNATLPPFAISVCSQTRFVKWDTPLMTLHKKQACVGWYLQIRSLLFTSPLPRASPHISHVYNMAAWLCHWRMWLDAAVDFKTSFHVKGESWTWQTIYYSNVRNQWMLLFSCFTKNTNTFVKVQIWSKCIYILLSANLSVIIWQ